MSATARSDFAVARIRSTKRSTLLCDFDGQVCFHRRRRFPFRSRQNHDRSTSTSIKDRDAIRFPESPRAGPRTSSARTNREPGRNPRVGGLVNVVFTFEPTNRRTSARSTRLSIGREESLKASPDVKAIGRPMKSCPTNGHRSRHGHAAPVSS